MSNPPGIDPQTGEIGADHELERRLAESVAAVKAEARTARIVEAIEGHIVDTLEDAGDAAVAIGGDICLAVALSAHSADRDAAWRAAFLRGLAADLVDGADEIEVPEFVGYLGDGRGVTEADLVDEAIEAGRGTP